MIARTLWISSRKVFCIVLVYLVHTVALTHADKYMDKRSNPDLFFQGSLLKQLTIANKSVGGGVIVVLAERNKEEMEMDIAKLEFDFMGTSVICRSGSPLIIADLKKVCTAMILSFFGRLILNCAQGVKSFIQSLLKNVNFPFSPIH